MVALKNWIALSKEKSIAKKKNRSLLTSVLAGAEGLDSRANCALGLPRGELVI